jgi:hypothetical protein
MPKGRPLTIEERAGVCYDYVYFDDSNGELARNYNLRKPKISESVKIGIAFGLITQKDYDLAAERRSVNANMKGGLSEEEKRALLQQIKKEIQSHQEGNLERLTTNKELGDSLSVSDSTIKRYLFILPKDEKEYRKEQLEKQGGKDRIELHGNPARDLTPEQRTANGKRGGKRSYELHGNPARDLTLEERRKNWEKGIGKLTPEQRRKNWEKGIGKLTPEQKSAIGKRGYQKRFEIYGPTQFTSEQRSLSYKNGIGKLTLEQRREIGKRGGKRGIELHGNPGRNLTPEQRVKNFLKAQATPNGLETILITGLSQLGLFAEDGNVAKTGQIYYPGKGPKKYYRKLQNGKFKLPDFKVKGQPKVIELYGDYWHSQEFCEVRGHPDYAWNPKRMVEEYAKVGVEAKVYIESELRNQERREEIIREIREWVSQVSQ